MSGTKRNIDILSFDGGGSRGIMELCILDDVLRLATIVLRRPEIVKSYLLKDEKDGSEKNPLKDREVRKRLINDLKDETDPIHPTEIYEMIVGTSTGALIAFGLTGGKEAEGGKRAMMSVKECIDMYLTKTKAIFKKTWLHWLLSHIPKLSSIPLTTYSQENVREALIEQFGQSSLEDFAGTNSKCIAGAVARKVGNEEELVLFDTRSEDYRLYKTYQVLLASSNAPVYFETPVQIGSNYFVDGGVGGNCPLAQAIPRAKELFGKDGKDAEITSVLSVAPPRPARKSIPCRLQIFYWLKYFVNESTDGYAVFRDVAKRNGRKKTLFQRLSPRGDGLKVFKLDEINAQKMMDAMESEKVNNDMFLIDIIATAMEVVFTSVDKIPDYNETALVVAAQLAQIAGYAYKSSEEYESAIVSYNTSIRLFKKINVENSKSFTVSMIYHEIAKCLKKQGKYQTAIRLFRSSVKFLISHHDANNATLLVDTVINLANCYVLTFRYEEAEDCLKEFLEKDIMKLENLVDALILMALCKQRQGKLDEAVKQYRETSSYIPENDSYEKAEILNNLGLCFVQLGMKDKGLHSIYEALKMRERLAKNQNDLHVAESLNNVGFCLIETGDYDRAHKNLNQAYKIYQEKGDDITMSNVLQNLARCLSFINRNQSRALTYAQQAFEKRRKHVGDLDNLGIARNLEIIGLCLFRSKRFDEAAEKLLKASEMMERLFKSESHPWLLEIYVILSELSKIRPDEHNTVEFYERKAVSIRDKISEMAKNIGEDQMISWKTIH